MGIISPQLRASAEGQECTLQIASVCNGDRSTTVLAHLPSEVKGMGNKSDDHSAVFSCSACHEAIDQHKLSKVDELFYMLRAWQRTLRIWIEAGLVLIPVDPHTAKRRPGKKMPKRASRPIPSRPFQKRTV